MKLALLIGWVVFVAFILAFNYGAHKNDLDDELYEPDNVRQLFPDDDDEHVIF